MKNCLNCGATFEDDVAVCASCGYHAPQEELKAEQMPAPIEEMIAEEPIAPTTYIPPHTPEQPQFAAPGQPYAMPVQPVYAAPEQPPYTMIRPEPAPKKRKVWLWSIASVLALAVIATSAWYFLLRKPKSNEVSINEAVRGCVDQLDELYADHENLTEFIESMKSFDFSNFTVSGGYDAEEDEFGMGLQVNMNVSTTADMIDGDMTLSIKYGEKNANINYKFASSDEMTQMSLPGLLDDVFCIDKDDSPLESEESLSIFTDAQCKLSDEQIKALYNDLIDSIQTTGVSEKTYALADQRVTCEIHAITYDEAIVQELLSGVFGDEAPEIEMENICLIVRENQCVGIIFDIEDDGEMQNGQILLGGIDNPWSDIYIYVDGEEKASIVTRSEESELTVEFIYEGEVSGRIVVDDEAQTITIEDTSSEDTEFDYDYDDAMQFGYGVEDGKLKLTISDSEYITATFYLSALEHEPKMLSDDPIYVDDMTEAERDRLMEELEENLKENPDYKWLFETVIG